MSKLRWDQYVLLSDSALDRMFIEHFSEPREVLLIMGKGFDIRMNFTLDKIKNLPININLTCQLISFEESEGSSSLQYKDYVDDNMKELKNLLQRSKLINSTIKLWKKDGRKKRRIGGRSASELFDNVDLTAYTDIIVDISALPRGIYFSLIGKLIALVDIIKDNKPNLMITVAENAELDKAIQDETPFDELAYLHGFSGGVDQTRSEQEEPIVWLPILGENKSLFLKKAYNFLGPNEICPVLPYPCKDPRRPDSLIVEYHDTLFDEYRVEAQNIMYVPEQNPFEAYKILSSTITNYHASLMTLGGCKAVLSTFSSKLLSIGTLLAAYELKANSIDVGVLNVDSQGYTIKKNIDMRKMKVESKLFVIWLTGIPYND